MDRCPLCRGRLKSTICGRCGADLSLVLHIEAQAKALSHYAVQNLLDGNYEQAAHLACQAKALHATPFQQALDGFIKSRKDIIDGDEVGQQEIAEPSPKPT